MSSISSLASSSPSDTNTSMGSKSISDHSRCDLEHCGFYEELATQLSSLPRSITLAYLGPERVRAFPFCSASLPLSTAATISTGWKKNQCTEEAVRDLLVEKMINIAADAARRTSTYSKNMKVLDQGYWYANDYFKYLSEKNQTQRIQHLKSKNNFYCGLPPKGFYSIHNPSFAGNSKPFSYQIKPETVPSEGLKNIRQKLCFIDCQEAIELAYYEALLEIWGEAKFNQVFDPKGRTPLKFDITLNETPVIQFISVKKIDSINKIEDRPVQLGDSVFFKNVPLYSIKHEEGEWGGLHVLCVQDEGKQKFAGFGTPPEGWTEEQILTHFADQFNQPPIPKDAIYEKQIIQTVDKQSKGLTGPVSQGMTLSKLQTIAQQLKFSGQKILKISEENPTDVGFNPQILYPNIKNIAEMLN